MKIFTKKSVFLGTLLLIFSGIISCEKDFTDIATTIINNGEFSTKDTILDVEITPVPIDKVRADGLSLGGGLGQYLLGVYNNPNYEKIEASIVSQLGISTNLKVVDRVYGADTTAITVIDTVILRVPYQATLTTGTSSEYTLDSIIGDTASPFKFNVYETSTYLNSLNPADPAQGNSYLSDMMYDIVGAELNTNPDYPFVPNETDTLFYVNRRLSTGETFRDTIVFTNNAPFARIPLKKAKFEEFMSKYEAAEFSSQDAFNDYFRGIILEASGDNGSLISLNLSGATNPSIEVYYTNTIVEDSTSEVLDTIVKNNSFPLSGIRNSIYKMTPNNTSANNHFVIQGAAGAMANVKIFGDDLDANSIPDQIDDLRSKDWLINDASLTLYVDQDIVEFDTIATPFRLFLYKNGFDANNNPNPSQIKDLLTEGFEALGGRRELSEDKKPNKYNFRITDYVSDLLNGTSDYAPILGIKVFNPTDLPTTIIDTIIETYSWNPKAVTLLNHLQINGTRRAQLKISYSERK